MPERYSVEEVRTRTPGISYSGMFQTPDSSFPCPKEKERGREREEKRTFTGAFIEAGFRVFRGVGRADATRLLESVSNARTKCQ